jgi:hypothetical protein
LEHFRQSRIPAVSKGSVIEGEAPVFDRDDDPSGAAQDLDVVLTFLVRIETPLDDVAADRFDSPVELLGGSVP